MRYILVLLALGVLALPALATDANMSGNSSSNVVANVTFNSSGLNLTDTAGLLATCSGNGSVDVGALPGDFMYGFKRFFENVDEFLTFDKGSSALKHAKYGMERAVEAHLLACQAHDQEQAGNTTQANVTVGMIQQLVSDQKNEMQESEKDLEDAVAAGTVSNGTVDQVENDSRTSIEVLQMVYDRAPESAKDGLLNALNNSIQNYQKHEEKMAAKGRYENSGGNETSNETSESWNQTIGHNHGHGDDQAGNDSGRGFGIGGNSTGGSGADGSGHGGSNNGAQGNNDGNGNGKGGG